MKHIKYILVDDLPEDEDYFGKPYNPYKKGRNAYRQEALEKARELTVEGLAKIILYNRDNSVSCLDLAKIILQKLEGGE